MEKINTNFDKLNNIKKEITAKKYLQETSLKDLLSKVNEIEEIAKEITKAWDETSPADVPDNVNWETKREEAVSIRLFYISYLLFKFFFLIYHRSQRLTRKTFIAVFIILKTISSLPRQNMSICFKSKKMQRLILFKLEKTVQMNFFFILVNQRTAFI